MKVLKEFKEFINKGNVVDLAVAVVIGGAFGKIVSALVADVIMPIVSLVLPDGEWRKAAITLRANAPDGPEGDVRLLVGDLASVVVDFLIVGFVLFLVVRALNRLKNRNPPPVAAPTTRECPECLERVALTAKRCKFCTSQLPVTA